MFQGTIKEPLNEFHNCKHTSTEHISRSGNYVCKVSSSCMAWKQPKFQTEVRAALFFWGRPLPAKKSRSHAQIPQHKTHCLQCHQLWHVTLVYHLMQNAQYCPLGMHHTAKRGREQKKKKSRRSLRRKHTCCSLSSVMRECREEKSLADTSWRQKEWVSSLAVKLAYWQHGNATFLLSPLIVNQFEKFLQYDASWRHPTTSSVQTKFAMGPGEHLSNYRNKKSILAVWQVKPDDETVYHIQSSHVCSWQSFGLREANIPIPNCSWGLSTMTPIHINIICIR